jgi:hypothetical protein
MEVAKPGRYRVWEAMEPPSHLIVILVAPSFGGTSVERCGAGARNACQKIEIHVARFGFSLLGHLCHPSNLKKA